MRTLSLYCDGSSSGKKNGPTGWAWVLVLNGTVIEWDYGGGYEGTNNTAEMTAAIEGLKKLSTKEKLLEELRKRNYTIELVCDSQYVLNMADRVYNPTTNHELVKQVIQYKETVGATTRWVRGHSGEPFNVKCDKLAKMGREVFTGEDE